MKKFDIEKLKGKNGKLSGIILSNFTKTEEYDYILNETSWMGELTSAPNRVYCVVNNIITPPLCICNNPLKFKGFSIGYANYCSMKCGIIGSNRSENTKKTLLEKYGSSTYNNRDKQRQTNLDRYGVESTNTLETIKEKQKNSKIERYGDAPDKWIFHNITKYVFKERYGDDTIPNSNMDYTELSRRFTPDAYTLLDDKEWCATQYKIKTTVDISNEIGVAHSTVNNYLIKHDILRNNWSSVSGEEKSLLSYIQSIYDGEVMQNTRKLISPYEIDIYIPEFKLAIEYNGLFWHNEDRVGKDYHYKKTKMCNDIGVELLHIFSNEWNEKSEIWKSVISNKLKKSNKVYARKCQIRVVNKDEAILFFKQNHLQSSINRGNFYGLFYNNQLVACINYGKSRYGKYDWEIYRYCNLINTTVVGGFSKLFNNIPITGSIVSYANMRWSIGNLYEICGFKYSHKTRPNYFYIKGNNLYSREKFQKHKLKFLLDKYDETKTEHINMKENGYNIIYDSGNLVYHTKKNLK